MAFVFVLALVLFISIPQDAYAYLDPASGNALISALIALAGVILYWFKSLFYRVISRRAAGVKIAGARFDGEEWPLVIFSEGKSYWSTFRPIVHELINRKTHFRYVSLDVHDPALCIDNEYMHSKLYYKNRRTFNRLSKIKATAMLSTTPNIGSPGYPLRRPPLVKKLVHVFHAMANIADYRKGSLDHYDSVLLIGEHEKKPIRVVEAARQTKEKELVTCGLPYLDDLYKQKQELEEETGHSKKDKQSKKSDITVLVAPSWGRKGCFNEYGIDFVEKLSKAGFAVIIRIHPHSNIYEPNNVAQWKDRTAKLSNVIWDSETFGTKAMSQADILVSDTSSVRFDFAFLYNKPVVTLNIPRESRDEFEGTYLDEIWTETVSHQIGTVIDNKSLDDIAEIVKRTLHDFSRHELLKLREKSIADFGNSASKIVSYLCHTVDEQSLPSAEEKNKNPPENDE
jgi:hypothetical protein